MSTSPHTATRKPALPSSLTEVRYSLPELLAEVLEERNAPVYASEQLEQVEIAKLFQKNRPSRATRNRK